MENSREHKKQLSARLTALADMVTIGNTVADVGCDHGFLSIYLVTENISPHVLAMDVRIGPLNAAISHIKEAGLEAYISTRLSDGISQMREGECESLVIAGMGGKLMKQLLSAEEHKTKSFKELILQPQSEIGMFRRYLRENGYRIISENMILEDGKYYPMMKAVVFTQKENEDPITVTDTEQLLYDTYGELLLTHKNPVLYEYLKKQLAALTKLAGELADNQTQKAKIRLTEIEEEIRLVHSALRFYQ